MNQPVGAGLGSRHPEVAFGVARCLLVVLSGCAREDAIESIAHLENLGRLGLDLGGASTGSAERPLGQSRFGSHEVLDEASR